MLKWSWIEAGSVSDRVLNLRDPPTGTPLHVIRIH